MKTGNCWNARHHTCNGWGLTSQKTEGKKHGKVEHYPCDCECHKERVK